MELLTLVVQTALTRLRLLALLTLPGESCGLVEEDLLLGSLPVLWPASRVRLVVDQVVVDVAVQDGGGRGAGSQLTHPAPHLQ